MSDGGHGDDAPPSGHRRSSPLSPADTEAAVDPYELTKETMSPPPSKVAGPQADDTDVRDVGPWLEAILGERATAEAQGQAPPKAASGEPAPGRPCPRCRFVGAHDARFCVQCGAGINIRAAEDGGATNADHAPNEEGVAASAVGR